jgi:CopG family transcriptional regulator/antitoxin EndoAI
MTEKAALDKGRVSLTPPGDGGYNYSRVFQYGPGGKRGIRKLPIKQIMIRIPSRLLDEVDAIISRRQGSRSQFIIEAMINHLQELRRRELRERLREGYIKMAAMWLAEDDAEDWADLNAYERCLANED